MPFARKLALLLTAAIPSSLMAAGGPNLPQPDPAFTGVMGQTVETSRAAYPDPVRAPAGAPNILIVLTDDVGFGAASTFGGPIPTPNLDRLAREGLTYSRFHTTAMCSPTRASLLTGRNHHNAGTGIVTDTATGFPGYNGVIPRSTATLAKVLTLNGYNTAMFGKHHNTPNGEMSAAGPFHHWPLGLGFEYFYGFLGGDSNQWHPRLFRDNQRAEAPDTIGENATLDKFLMDDAIHWLHNQTAAAPDKPFLLYASFGTAHSPHQAPAEWVEKFRGQFDQGWDRIRPEILSRQKKKGIAPANTELTKRPEQIPAWDSFSTDEKLVASRMMEAYAATLAYQDHQFGRLLDELDRTGQRDNTLILFIEGDNGSSSEGGIHGVMNELGRMANNVPESTEYQLSVLDKLGTPETYSLYPVGWAWALDTPFQWTKQVGSHLGGTRNGMVVSWPAQIKDTGKVRSQFAHVVDVAPTIYDILGIEAPAHVDGIAQKPIDGVSFRYTFGPKPAPEPSRTQYFEMIGNRAIYKDGWMASTTPGRMPWALGGSGMAPTDYKWELYNLNKDYSQAHDLADRHPDKLAELQALWDREAKANNVYPLNDVQGSTRAAQAIRPGDAPRASYVYWGKDISAPIFRAPMLGLFPFTMDADIVVPKDGLDGVLVASGSRFGGWSFYFEDGKPVVTHAFSEQPAHTFRIASDTVVPAGKARLSYRFTANGKPGEGGKLAIFVNGKEAGSGEIPRTVFMIAGLGETFDTGRDTGATVVDYKGSNAFTGDITKIEVRQTLPTR